MADSLIANLTAITGANLAAGDLIPVVDVSDTTLDATGTTKKITKAELASAVGGGGSGVGDYILVYAGNLPLPVDTLNAIVTFQYANDPIPRGTSITWDGSQTLTIHEDGLYSVSWMCDPGIPDPTKTFDFLSWPVWNDDATGPFYYLSAGAWYNGAQAINAKGPPGCVVWPFEAGDTLKLTMSGGDSTIGQVAGNFMTAAMTVTRIS